MLAAGRDARPLFLLVSRLSSARAYLLLKHSLDSFLNEPTSPHNNFKLSDPIAEPLSEGRIANL